jgi:hypothetical protein
LDGALTLDANGENGAYWVFQIGTTLITTPGSMVTLIDPGTNLGSDDGIFWDAQSGITINAGSQILGNYLAGTSVTFSGTTSGSGRGLAQAQVTLEDNLINSQAPNGGDWTGGLVYNSSGAVVPIPEPATFLWLLPLGALGFVLWQRRPSVANKICCEKAAAHRHE